MARVRERAIADFENTVNVKHPGRLNAVDSFTYITAVGDQDLSGLAMGNHTVMVNVQLAHTNFIRLPEATTGNGGMHIRIVVGLAPANEVYVGTVSSVLVGGATAVGDTNEGNAPTDVASATSALGTGNLSLTFDLNDANHSGWEAGSVLDFYYTGVANLIIYRGSLLSEVDDPTLSSHFSTTAVNAH